ncbi:efflux RND transporter periplasmic adaptor subunit [Neomicrococcus lactis]|uniref:Peptidoglycan-binding protein n=1 Tax=Neomicrococcus lactis TaxID=732241 RepID=A0A7W9DBN5_9MICC|nr:hypothetical protein [Neomicrococcus lactis]MBB5598072.1 hypothetical protein [Neomicrococcus lactis]
MRQSYGIDASWASSVVATGGNTGTITTIDMPLDGQSTVSGSRVFSVDLQPIFVINGKIPSFRDLSSGVSGADVQQLQDFLVSKRYLGTTFTRTRFDNATNTAVSKWAKDAGFSYDGTLPRWRVIYVPDLPKVLVPLESLRVGAQISQGQELLQGPVADPVFSFRVLPENVSKITPGLKVVIDTSGEQWSGRVSRLENTAGDVSETVAILEPEQGQASICGGECSRAVKLGDKTVLPGIIELIPEQTGVQIPTAAVRTDANNKTFVFISDGVRRDITLKVSDQGKSIVEGINVGNRVLLGDASEEQTP